MGLTQFQMSVLTFISILAIAIFAQLKFSLTLVPITGQTLALGLAATVLGARYATYSAGFYLLLGALGLPFFSGMSSGLTVILGPKGGYLLSFIPAAFFIGFYLEKTAFTKRNAWLANILAMFFILGFGMIWLKFVAEISWSRAFFGGFAPFVIGGLIKALLAGWLGIHLRNLIRKKQQ